MKARLAPLFLLLAQSNACAPYVDAGEYARSLAEPPCAKPASAPAPSYEIPADAPEGHLVIEAPTMTSLAPRHGAADDAPLHAVQLVVVVTNRSNESWFMNRDEQAVDLSTRDQCVVLSAVATSTSASTSIEVKPHAENWISLYFDLPPTFRGQDAASYQVVWVVHVGARRVVGRTTFDEKREAT